MGGDQVLAAAAPGWEKETFGEDSVNIGLLA